MAKLNQTNDVKADNASDVKLETLKTGETTTDQGNSSNIDDQKNPPPALKDQAIIAANKGEGSAVTMDEAEAADKSVLDPETKKVVYATAAAYQESLKK